MFAYILAAAILPMTTPPSDSDPANDVDIDAAAVETAFEDSASADSLCSSYIALTDLFSASGLVEGQKDMDQLVAMADAWLADRFEDGAEGRLTIEGHEAFIESLHECDGAPPLPAIDDPTTGSAPDDSAPESSTDATASDDTVTDGTGTGASGTIDYQQIFADMGIDLTDEQATCLVENAGGLDTNDTGDMMSLLQECDIDLADLMPTGDTTG